jgi:hypothetical protein
MKLFLSIGRWTYILGIAIPSLWLTWMMARVFTKWRDHPWRPGRDKFLYTFPEWCEGATSTLVGLSAVIFVALVTQFVVFFHLISLMPYSWK